MMKSAERFSGKDLPGRLTRHETVLKHDVDISREKATTSARVRSFAFHLVAAERIPHHLESRPVDSRAELVHSQRPKWVWLMGSFICGFQTLYATIAIVACCVLRTRVRDSKIAPLPRKRERKTEKENVTPLDSVY